MDISKHILYSASKCGHLTPQYGDISAYGRTFTKELLLNCVHSVDYCLKCIQNMSIRCVLCGKAIFIGEPITFYLTNQIEHIPVYAKFIKGKFIGCLDQQCSKPGATFKGYWEISAKGIGFVLEAPTILATFFQSRTTHTMRT